MRVTSPTLAGFVALAAVFDPGGTGPKHRELAPTSPGVLLQPRETKAVARDGIRRCCAARLAGRLVVGSVRSR
jgi:hypothetical protein